MRRQPLAVSRLRVRRLGCGSKPTTSTASSSTTPHPAAPERNVPTRAARCLWIISVVIGEPVRYGALRCLDVTVDDRNGAHTGANFDSVTARVEAPLRFPSLTHLIIRGVDVVVDDDDTVTSIGAVVEYALALPALERVDIHIGRIMDSGAIHDARLLWWDAETTQLALRDRTRATLAKLSRALGESGGASDADAAPQRSLAHTISLQHSDALRCDMRCRFLRTKIDELCAERRRMGSPYTFDPRRPLAVRLVPSSAHAAGREFYGDEALLWYMMSASYAAHAAETRFIVSLCRRVFGDGRCRIVSVDVDYPRPSQAVLDHLAALCASRTAAAALPPAAIETL
jgi:hypothetical protein